MIGIAERRVALLNGGLQRAHEEMNEAQRQLDQATQAWRSLVEMGMTLTDADIACDISRLERAVESTRLAFEEINHAVYLAVAGGIR